MKITRCTGVFLLTSEIKNSIRSILVDLKNLKTEHYCQQQVFAQRECYIVEFVELGCSI